MQQSSVLDGGNRGVPLLAGYGALLTLCAAQFVVVLSFQGAAITLPLMQEAFGASPVVGQWLVSANALAFGGLLLLTGRAGDVIGHRRLFTSGLAMFAASSFVAGVAPSIGWLIVARIAQGVGLAMYVPACLALLVATYPEGPSRHRAMAAWGMSGPFGGIAALLCSGFLIESFSWRALYLLMAVVALVPAALSRVVFPADPPRGAAALDPGTALLGTAGIGALLFGLGEASQVGLTARVIVSILLGGVLLLTFVVRERRGAAPLVPPAMWRQPGLRAAAATGFMNGASTNTPIVFYVLYLQGQGMTPLQISLGFIPCNIAIIGASVLVPRLVARRGVTGAMAWGMAVVVAGLLVLTTLPIGGTYLQTFLPGLLLVGFGLGWAQVGIVGTAVESVSAAEQGIAAGLVNTGAQVGTAVGLALLIALSTTVGSRAGAVAGYSAAFLGAAGFAVVGVLAALSACRAQWDARVVMENGSRSPRPWAGVEQARG
jgi:MFS family permease